MTRVLLALVVLVDVAVAEPLADELANLDAAWQFSADTATFTRGDQQIAVETVPGCEAYRIDPRVHGLELYRQSLAAPGIFCLRHHDHGVLVRVGDGRALAPTDHPAHALLRAISERLRPPVEIPALGTSLREALVVEPTADGFDAIGAVRTRFTVSHHAGTCGMITRDANSFSPVAPIGVTIPPLFGTAHHLVLCLERADDTIVISIHDPAFEPSSPGRRPTLERDLALVIGVLARSVPRGPPPRMFDNTSTPLALPNTHVELRARHATGGGWFTADHLPAHKLVDGAEWGEPDADVLLPIAPYAYAVAVRREPCIPRTSPSPFVPREVATTDITGTRYLARACIRGTITASVLEVGVQEAPTDPERARLVIASLARSQGIRVAGRQARVDAHLAATFPMYTASTRRRAGIAARAGGTLVGNRPFGVLIVGGLAFGGADDEFFPDVEMHRPDELVEADGLFELYGGAGAAATLGPLTVGAALTFNVDNFWPGDRDLYRALALAALQIGELVHVEGHATVGTETRQTAQELIVRLGPIVALARHVELVDTDASHGFEFGIGYMDRR